MPVATTDTGTPVVVAGTDFAAVRRLDSWWQVMLGLICGGRMLRCWVKRAAQLSE